MTCSASGVPFLWITSVPVIVRWIPMIPLWGGNPRRSWRGGEEDYGSDSQQADARFPSPRHETALPLTRLSLADASPKPAPTAQRMVSRCPGVGHAPAIPQEQRDREPTTRSRIVMSPAALLGSRPWVPAHDSRPGAIPGATGLAIQRLD